MPSSFTEARKRQLARLNGAKPPTPRAAMALAKSQAYQASTHDLLKIVRLAVLCLEQTLDSAHSKRQLPSGTVVEQVYESLNRPGARRHVCESL